MEESKEVLSPFARCPIRDAVRGTEALTRIMIKEIKEGKFDRQKLRDWAFVVSQTAKIVEEMT